MSTENILAIAVIVVILICFAQAKNGVGPTAEGIHGKELTGSKTITMGGLGLTHSTLGNGILGYGKMHGIWVPNISGDVLKLKPAGSKYVIFNESNGAYLNETGVKSQVNSRRAIWNPARALEVDITPIGGSLYSISYDSSNGAKGYLTLDSTLFAEDGSGSKTAIFSSLPAAVEINTIDS